MTFFLSVTGPWLTQFWPGISEVGTTETDRSNRGRVVRVFLGSASYRASEQVRGIGPTLPGLEGRGGTAQPAPEPPEGPCHRSGPGHWIGNPRRGPEIPGSRGPGCGPFGLPRKETPSSTPLSGMRVGRCALRRPSPVSRGPSLVSSRRWPVSAGSLLWDSRRPSRVPARRGTAELLSQLRAADR